MIIGFLQTKYFVIMSQFSSTFDKNIILCAVYSNFSESEMIF